MDRDRIVTDVQSAVAALTRGFAEPVEYVVEVNGIREAKRTYRRHEGLIAQLELNSTTPLQSRVGGGGGGKPGSRPPINQVYADMVDTIHEQALIAWGLVIDQDVCKRTLTSLIIGIGLLVETRCEEIPHDCGTVARMLNKWVHDARVLLGYESRKVVLADTVCGQCGGTLIVAIDATSDVRCIGTEAADSCGMVYNRLEWVSLLHS